MSEEMSIPTHSDLKKRTKAELVNELWGELQTNLELNQQLRALREPVQCYQSYGLTDSTCTKPKGHTGKHGTLRALSAQTPTEPK